MLHNWYLRPGSYFSSTFQTGLLFFEQCKHVLWTCHFQGYKETCYRSVYRPWDNFSLVGKLNNIVNHRWTSVWGNFFHFRFLHLWTIYRWGPHAAGAQGPSARGDGPLGQTAPSPTAAVYTYTTVHICIILCIYTELVMYLIKTSLVSLRFPLHFSDRKVLYSVFILPPHSALTIPNPQCHTFPEWFIGYF